MHGTARVGRSALLSLALTLVMLGWLAPASPDANDARQWRSPVTAEHASLTPDYPYPQARPVPKPSHDFAAASPDHWWAILAPHTSVGIAGGLWSISRVGRADMPTTGAIGYLSRAPPSV